MVSIRYLSVTQFRIFRPDAVPFALLRTPVGSGHLKTQMGFRTVGFNAETGDLVFEDGAFRRNEGGPLIVVTSAAFNNRRIVLSVIGDSELAQGAYATIQELFSASGFTLPDPVISTEETICVAELDFEWQALLNPEISSMATEFAKGLPVVPRIRGAGIKITFGFSPDQHLEEYGANLNDKQLVVEPRADVPLSERVYFTASPSGSEAHIALVEALEARIMRKTEKRPGKHSRA